MRNLILSTVILMVGFLYQFNTLAEDAEKKVLKGELIVTAEGEEISKIVLKKVDKIEDEDAIVTFYVVKLDDTSKKMAKELKGKEVEIEGVVVEVEKGDDIENHLTVSKYKAVEAKKAAAKEVDADLE